MFNVLSYISIIVIVFILTYIFDVKENYIMLYMLLIAPILDFSIYTYYKKNVFVKSFLTDECIQKRERIYCDVELINDGYIPVLFLEYKFIFNEKFECMDNFKETISLGAKRIIKKNFVLKAIHRGEGEVQLSEAQITSVMGLFKGKINIESDMCKVLITPALIEVENVDKLLESTIRDDNEDETSSSLFSGEPGYEYKNYAPGDPLNKVNWKLSSKTGDLYIRKNTTDIKRKKILILDPLIENKTSFEDYGDLLIEGIIGILKELYALDYEAEIYYLEEKLVKHLIFEDNSSIELIKEKFSSYNFEKLKVANRFNNFIFNIEENCDFILFTTSKDKDVEKFVLEINHSENNAVIISNDKNKIFENELFLSENYELEVL